jgi:hypothetical protein
MWRVVRIAVVAAAVAITIGAAKADTVTLLSATADNNNVVVSGSFQNTG